jgi:hypothetical protein
MTESRANLSQISTESFISQNKAILVAGDRFTSVEQVELITDPDAKARREAENGLRQTELALEIIRNFVKDKERPFRLRQGLLMQLHAVVLEGIHLLAGTLWTRENPRQ